MPQITTDQAIALAHQRHQAGQMGEAEAICRRILAIQPNHAAALHLLGMLACQAGQLGAAVDLIRQSIRLAPDSLEAHTNLGVVLNRLGRYDEAVAAHRQAIQLNPQSADAHYNLGVALRNGGQTRQSIAAFRQAVRLRPDFADAYNNLGNAHRDLAELDDAIAAYRQAILVEPGHSGAHNNLGTVLREAGQLDAAFAEHRRAMALRPQATPPHDNLLVAMNFHPGCDPAMIDAELSRWHTQHGQPLEKFILPHANDRDPNRRLRIGYISADFRYHACANFLLPLIKSHDHQQFEITCYSAVPKTDALTETFEKLADRWRPVVHLADAPLADLIRSDGIDILIDAMGHTAGNRLTALARKPAPILASWMGYVSVSALRTIDYRLTDAHLQPLEADENRAFQKPVRLPDSLWCYDPMATEPSVNELPALAASAVTFGCLNNYAKINDSVMSAWARILLSVAESRLLILSPEGYARRRFLEGMASRGIESGRLEFTAGIPRAAYLELYHRLDISLDPFPYNGHTTSLDSWWMGVPVVTLAGRTAVGRIGLSHAASLQTNELVARDEEEYVRIAVELAKDLPRLAELRRTLRGRLEASPLMDAPRFARNVEAAYREMWREWCSR